MSSAIATRIQLTRRTLLQHLLVGSIAAGGAGSLSGCGGGTEERRASSFLLVGGRGVRLLASPSVRVKWQT